MNDAYKRLIAHTVTMESIDAETDLCSTSVIIEVSKQSVSKWQTRLTEKYGSPRTSGVANTIFEGPFCQYKGRGGRPGPITIVLYEDPQDKVPKLHIRCANYMAWIQEQRMPLHLHVQNDKKLMFDQVRKRQGGGSANCFGVRPYISS